jgi:hypothetical protein
MRVKIMNKKRTLLLFMTPIFLILFLSKYVIGIFPSYFKIRNYVIEHFPEYDLYVGFPEWNFKRGYFFSNITSKNDRNISFNVFYWGNGRFWNFYGDVLTYYITQILKQEFDDEYLKVKFINNFSAIEHNPRAHDNLRITMNLKDTNLDTLYDIINRTWYIIAANGFEFRNYNFNFIDCKRDIVNINILSTQYNKDHLMDTLEIMYENNWSWGDEVIENYD